MTAWAVGLALVLCGCSASRGTVASADANWMPRVEAVVGRANPALQVRVQAAANSVKGGQALKVRVFSNAPGFVYLLQLDAQGRTLRMVFPNAVDEANFMGAGYLDLPRGAWRMPAHDPASMAYLVAIVSPTQLDLSALQAQIAYGRFELVGNYGAAMVPLRDGRP